MTIPIFEKVYASQAQIVPTLAELFAEREEWWQWYAIDADGRGHYYEKEPFVDDVFWGWDGGSMFGYKHDMAGANWQACIYCRPIEPTENDKQLFATVESLRQAIGQATYVVMPADPALNGKTHTQEGPL